MSLRRRTPRHVPAHRAPSTKPTEARTIVTDDRDESESRHAAMQVKAALAHLAAG